MRVKEGIGEYLQRSFASDYFHKIDKKVHDIKIFS